MNKIIVLARTSDNTWPDRAWWILILIFAALMRFYRADWAALWYDEAFSVVMSTHSPAKAVSIAATDVHPPLYYLVLKTWISMFGSELYALRALSACAGVIAVGLGVWLTRQVATRRAAVFAGILLAMLPVAIRYSHEVRMYALLSVWMTGATIALVYWVKRPDRHRYLVIYAVLIAAGLYTHYFAILGIMSHWLYVLCIRQPLDTGRPRRIFYPQWWVANTVAGLLFVPWLPVLMAQLSNASSLGWIQPVTLRSLPSTLWQYLILNNGTELTAFVYWGLMPLILALCVYCMVHDKQPQRFSWLLVIYLWAPLLVMFIVSLHFPLFIARYFTFSALSLPILLGVGLDRLMRNHRWLTGLIFVAFLGTESVGIYNLYGAQDNSNDDNRPRQERINVLTSVINEHFQPNDQIIVLNYFWYSSVAYYNTHPVLPVLYAPVVADGMKCRIYCRFKAPYDVQNEAIYLARLNALPARTHRVWLVDGATDSDVALVIPCNWLLQDLWVAGDNRLRLYRIQAGQVSNAKACPAT